MLGRVIRTRAGAGTIDLGIGRDDVAHLRELIARGLKADVLVLSGGVSAACSIWCPAYSKSSAWSKSSTKSASSPASRYGLG